MKKVKRSHSTFEPFKQSYLQWLI